MTEKEFSGLKEIVAKLEGRMVELEKENAKLVKENEALKAQKSVKLVDFTSLRDNIWNGYNVGLDIKFGRDMLTATQSGKYGWNTVRAEIPVDLSNFAMHPKPYIAVYYEVQVQKKGNGYHEMRIGFADHKFPCDGYDVGEKNGSIGMFCKRGISYGCSRLCFQSNSNADFKSGDVVGCGLLICSSADSSVTFFASCNGTLIGKLPLSTPVEPFLFPAVSFFRTDESVKANFGKQRFRYDPNQLLVEFGEE